MTNLLLKLSRDYFYLGPAQVTDQPGRCCETTITNHMTKQPTLKMSRDYFYLGPAQVTDQPGSFVRLHKLATPPTYF
jgi:hypothetical protein